MRKLFVSKLVMGLFLLLIPTFCLQAQDSARKSSKDSDLVTVQGCLQIKNNTYILTEGDGTQHELVGADTKLSHQRDREVEITGKRSTRTWDTTVQTLASSTEEHPVIEVKTVKRLADACQ